MSDTIFWWLMGLSFTTSTWPWVRVIGMVVITVCMVVSLIQKWRNL